MSLQDNFYQDITIDTGADFSMTFTAFTEGSTPVDLTGANVTAQMREYPEGNMPTAFACSHNDTGGQITIRMSHEKTSSISYSYGWYNVSVQFPDESVEEVLHGKVFVKKDVTRLRDNGYIYDIVSFPSFDVFPVRGNLYRIYLDVTYARLYTWDGSMYLPIAAKGDPGFGIQSVEKIDTTGLADTYRINFENSNKEPFIFTVTNGEKGDPGTGITSIEKTGSDGVEDYYRINFTDGEPFDYVITNGEKGSPGKDGFASMDYDQENERLKFIFDETSTGELPNSPISANISQLEIFNNIIGYIKDTVARNDAAAAQSTAAAAQSTANDKVSKSGDTMTGDLIISKAGSATIRFSVDGNPASYIRAYPDSENSSYGNVLVIYGGQSTIIGGGEFAYNAYSNNIDSCSSGEGLYLGADAGAYLYTNANKIANRKTWTFETDGSTTMPGAATIPGTLILSKTTDASGIANNSPALIVGGTVSQTHLELDANEIMSKTDGTTAGPIYINNDGGAVVIGPGGLTLPSAQYGTADKTSNTTALTTGQIYLQYE